MSYDSSVKIHSAHSEGGRSGVAATGPGLVQVVEFVVLVLEFRRSLGQHVRGGESLPVDAVVCPEVNHQVGPARLDWVWRLEQARNRSGKVGHS